MISIRTLTPVDAALWKEFRLYALQESPLAFGSTYQEEVVFTDMQWTQQLEKTTIFGAFSGERLVGCAGFRIHEMLQMKHRGIFFGMYVRPEFRGQGSAGQLLRVLIAYAKTVVIQLHCGVKLINESAIALYNKYGFVRYMIEPRSIKVGDTYYDDTWMVLKFDTDKN
jgi:RimJ/RimL family protein N-acetyltransferase